VPPIAAGSRDVHLLDRGSLRFQSDKLDAKIHDLNLEDYVSFGEA
jgi:hypothetical protein